MVVPEYSEKARVAIACGAGKTTMLHGISWINLRTLTQALFQQFSSAAAVLIATDCPTYTLSSLVCIIPNQLLCSSMF